MSATQTPSAEKRAPLIFAPRRRACVDLRFFDRAIVVVVVTLGLLVPNSHAAEKFQKLSGAQIRAKFIGMEMSDNVHWADVYGANGELKTYSMGRKKDGRWRVEKDELCVDRGKDDGGCYQVWLSGKNIELRREGLPAAFEGVLQRPVARN